MTKKTITIDLADLLAERAHHAREIDRIDSALAVVKTLAKRRIIVAKKVEKVRAKAAAAAAPVGRRAPRPGNITTGEHTNAAKLARRKRTAALLAHFDTDTPRSLNGFGKGGGSLIASGYLRAKGDGYVRTAKPFEVNG